MAGAPYGIIDEDTDVSEWAVTPTSGGGRQRLKNLLGATVNIDTFGAVADGITDSSAAVQAAVSSGKLAYVPQTTLGYVFGNIVTTGGTQGIIGNGSLVLPAPGSNWLIKAGTSKPIIRDLVIQDSDTNPACTKQTTVVSGGTLSSQTIVVADWTAVAGVAPALQVGQRYAIRTDNGTYESGYITSVAPGSGTQATIGLSLPIGWAHFSPAAASAGQTFLASFGLVYLTTGAADWRVRDLIFSNNWLALHLDDPTIATSLSHGYISHIGINHGRIHGLCIGRNVHDADYSHIINVGGNSKTVTGTGDGVTTQFSFGGDYVWKNEGITFIANGVTLLSGTDYNIDTTGLTVTTTSPIALGAPYSIKLSRHGPDGLMIDATGLNAHGQTNAANRIANCSFLAYARSLNVQDTPTTGNFSHCIFDSASVAAGRISGNAGYFTGVRFEFGQISLWVTGTTGGFKGDVSVNPPDASHNTAGSAGVPVRIDSGAQFTGTVYRADTRGFDLYDKGALAATQNANNGFSLYGQLLVAQNAAASPAPLSAYGAQFVAPDGSTCRIETVTFGTGVNPTLTGRAARGTNPTPLAVAQGDVLQEVSARGYDGTAWSTKQVAVQLTADGTWTSSSHPTRVDILVTPNSSTTINSSGWRFNHDDGLYHVGATGASSGSGSINCEKGYYIQSAPTSAMANGALVKQTSAASYTVAAGVCKVILDGVTSPYTLTMPAVAIAGQTVDVVLGANIASLTVSPNSGQTLKTAFSAVSATAGAGHRWTFDGTSIWYQDF